MKQILTMILLSLIPIKILATPITLDFSSGSYDVNNRKYLEDGFKVTANYGFHNIRLGTLAWYETSSTITVSLENGMLFDVKSLTVVNRPFLGLVFESSKGGTVSIGSITGPLDFSGEKWNSISSFTIKAGSNYADILNQVDNINLNLARIKVVEPSTLLLLLFSYIFLFIKRNSKLFFVLQK